MQWATPRGPAAWLRLQLEFTNLEQSGAPPGPTWPDFYSGLSVPQGYTQRGQVIGAAIGPGASSQWLAADYIRKRWQAGAYVSRIRWDNDALYRQPQANLKLIAELRAKGAADHNGSAGMIEVFSGIAGFFQSLASRVEQHELQRVRLIDLLRRNLELPPVVFVVGNEAAAAGWREA